MSTYAILCLASVVFVVLWSVLIHVWRFRIAPSCGILVANRELCVPCVCVGWGGVGVSLFLVAPLFASDPSVCSHLCMVIFLLFSPYLVDYARC